MNVNFGWKRCLQVGDGLGQTRDSEIGVTREDFVRNYDSVLGVRPCGDDHQEMWLAECVRLSGVFGIGAENGKRHLVRIHGVDADVHRLAGIPQGLGLVIVSIGSLRSMLLVVLVSNGHELLLILMCGRLVADLGLEQNTVTALGKAVVRWDLDVTGILFPQSVEV